jgi:hypothetical protein
MLDLGKEGDITDEREGVDTAAGCRILGELFEAGVQHIMRFLEDLGVVCVRFGGGGAFVVA